MTAKKQMSERRKTDLAIIEKLGEIHTNLALNTQETARIAEYQKVTNGKVAAHEVRLQAIESNQALISNNLAVATAANTAKSNELRGWRDWAIKGIIAIIVMLFYWLLTHNGFPNFLS